MSKVNLQSVLEKLVNEDREQASGLLHQWFVEKCAEINKSLVEDVHIHIHGDDEDGVEVSGGRGTPLSDGPDYADPDLDGQELPIGDFQEDEGDENPFAGGDEATDDLGGETGDDMDGVDDEEGLDIPDADGEEGSEEPDLDGETGDDNDPEALEDQVEDLEAELADLKDQLKAFIDGDEGSEEGSEDDSEADEAGDHEEPDGDEDAEGEEPDSEADGDDDADDVEESFDFSDLEESFQLELIKDPGLSGSKEVGATGASVNVNSTSPIPQKKTTERVGGKTVEIKSTQHKGYEREVAPKVSDKNPLRNQSVGNAMRDYTPISKEGDKSAVLNKKGDGFGSDSPKSPIGAGATDLRGDTFKRK
jgi:hypothetical protein